MSEFREEHGFDRRLLLVTGRRWLDTCRLALAAHEAGFEVHLLAPKGHPVASLSWVTSVEMYSSWRPSRSVARALNRFRCDLIVPVDDLGAAALFAAYRDRSLNERARQLIRRSLGDPETFAVRHSRAALTEVAAMAGLPAPRSWTVHDEDALPDLLRASGFPAVLKADGGSGGEQVVVVHDLAAAQLAFRRLALPPRVVGSVGWLLFDHDAGYLRSCLLRIKPAVTLQQFLPGDPATLSAVAWRGELLGSVGFRALRTRSPCGPATLVEPLHHADMERAAKTVARRFGLSGVFGLDFVLAPDGSVASLLELNPRATPTSHLYLDGMPRPLLHLLADCFGDWRAPVPAPLSLGRIGLFPQVMVWAADSQSFHDFDLDLPGATEVLDLCMRAVPPSTTLPPAAVKHPAASLLDSRN